MSTSGNVLRDEAMIWYAMLSTATVRSIDREIDWLFSFLSLSETRGEIMVDRPTDSLTHSLAAASWKATVDSTTTRALKLAMNEWTLLCTHISIYLPIHLFNKQQQQLHCTCLETHFALVERIDDARCVFKRWNSSMTMIHLQASHSVSQLRRVMYLLYALSLLLSFSS